MSVTFQRTVQYMKKSTTIYPWIIKHQYKPRRCYKKRESNIKEAPFLPPHVTTGKASSIAGGMIPHTPSRPESASNRLGNEYVPFSQHTGKVQPQEGRNKVSFSTSTCGDPSPCQRERCPEDSGTIFTLSPGWETLRQQHTHVSKAETHSTLSLRAGWEVTCVCAVLVSLHRLNENLS